MTQPTPEKFIAAARALTGTRWQHQGRSERGVDCVGLLILAAEEAGIIIEAERNYRRTPNDGRLAYLLDKYCVRLPKAEPAQAGDIIAIRHEAEPQHVAIVTEATRWGPKIIHANGNEQMGGAVVEHLLDDRWLKSHRSKIHATFRPKVWAGELREKVKEDCGCGA